MCCFTHSDPACGGTFATDPRLACQCRCGGVPCLRQADGEDFRCAPCRDGAELPGPAFPVLYDEAGFFSADASGVRYEAATSAEGLRYYRIRALPPPGAAEYLRSRPEAG